MGEGVTLPGLSPRSNAWGPIKLLFFSKFVAAVHHCRVKLKLKLKLKLFHFRLIDWWCILDMACYWTIAGHLKHSFRVGLCAKFWISLRVLFCCVGEFYCRSRKSTNCCVTHFQEQARYGFLILLPRLPRLPSDISTDPIHQWLLNYLQSFLLKQSNRFWTSFIVTCCSDCFLLKKKTGIARIVITITITP